MSTAAASNCQLAPREKTVSRRKNKAKMHANTINMPGYVPIIALTLSAVGWALMFWEKRKNALLKQQILELEATYTSQVTASR